MRLEVTWASDDPASSWVAGSNIIEEVDKEGKGTGQKGAGRGRGRGRRGRAGGGGKGNELSNVALKGL